MSNPEVKFAQSDFQAIYDLLELADAELDIFDEGQVKEVLRDGVEPLELIEDRLALAGLERLYNDRYNQSPRLRLRRLVDIDSFDQDPLSIDYNTLALEVITAAFKLNETTDNAGTVDHALRLDASSLLSTTDASHTYFLRNDHPVSVEEVEDIIPYKYILPDVGSCRSHCSDDAAPLFRQFDKPFMRVPNSGGRAQVFNYHSWRWQPDESGLVRPPHRIIQRKKAEPPPREQSRRFFPRRR